MALENNFIINYYNVFLLLFITYSYINYDRLSDKLMVLYDFFNHCNKHIYPEYWCEKYDSDSDSDYDSDSDSNGDNDVGQTDKPSQPKYEDKYLDKVRTIKNNWNFTEEELNELNELTKKFEKEYINNHKERNDEIALEIENIIKEMAEDVDKVNYVENSDEDGNSFIDETTLEERNEYRRYLIDTRRKLLDNIRNELADENTINKLAYDQALTYMSNKRIDKLTNSYVIEKTPVGNVLLFYDKERSNFKYYSDSVVPYRYLEVVCRKFVLFFDCRPLYVDMDEELKLFEEKWEKDQEIKKQKEELERMKKEENRQKNIQTAEPKKNVFAKFKTYNKTAGSQISMAPPKTNANSAPQTKEDAKVLLKEKANVYNNGGKFVNFNFLKKPEKKVFDKKLSLTFADFKKLQIKK